MFSTTVVAVFALITTVAAAPAPLGPGECAPSTGRWQVCNGFAGCCKADVCTLKLNYCPDTWTPAPVDNSKTKVPGPVQPSIDSSTCPQNKWFVCSNGFRGCCTTSDPCTVGWCPPATSPAMVPREETAAVVEKVRRDDTVCPLGTGYFQSCSNGFRGCCTSDVCSQKTPYCSSASAPAPIPPTKEETSTPGSAVQPQNGICPSGTGYYQVCSNGFKGCCSKDACGLGYCPN